MTGFGRAEKIENSNRYIMEIRTLNSQKGFDLAFRMPSAYRDLEYELRTRLAEGLQRGKIDFAFSVKGIGSDSLHINHELLKSYYYSLKKTAEELGQNTDSIFSELLKIPEVLLQDTVLELSDNEKKIIFQLMDECLQKTNLFRVEDGKKLSAEFKQRIISIKGFLTEIMELDKGRVTAIKERLRKNIEAFIPMEKIDANRYEQEVIYYIEKIDISEEVTRLFTHLEHFLQAMDQNQDAIGRKLNFISQEIGREINTIGSKANDATLQKIVIHMKDELEKIKEQLGNVL